MVSEYHRGRLLRRVSEYHVRRAALQDEFLLISPLDSPVQIPSSIPRLIPVRSVCTVLLSPREYGGLCTSPRGGIHTAPAIPPSITPQPLVKPRRMQERASDFPTLPPAIR